ncbi:MAG: pantetheine-phosphate adenylyltransferase [Clostridia bacterium]|nr:pantetheine-phosphate adenylyltransferase [Clostridia bacterium]
MTTAICPGSFDPVTIGHVDIIKRAAKMFDRVIVAVLVNMEKKPWFTIEERTELLKKATEGIENVEIVGFEGLLVDFAAANHADAIVKGLRAISDFEYEFQMALTNNKLNPDVETVFLTTSAENMYLSSSIVKQVGLLGGDISPFVPECVHDEILLRIRQRSNLK